MSEPELSELDYLREIERLAHDVTVEASAEDRLSYAEDPPDATPFQRSVNALARAVRSYHFEGDGCVEDRPLLKLAAAAVLKPGAMPAGAEEDYEQACARFGVEPRPEGWALWHTWGEGGLQVTMVVSAVGTTEGLFRNWSLGRELDPVTPLPSQIALVHHGWTGPMTFAPRGHRRFGLTGAPLS
ncbi:hypothetical protein ACFVVU_20675 [Kitasatospora sp. NPDC057965]|uniref:hypothetical protein n=1 Tax=Kitasatospora sp. NPDC057965 TaxID=3346291 RepID=UPI0036D87145